jgi:Calx-beta domain
MWFRSPLPSVTSRTSPKRSRSARRRPRTCLGVSSLEDRCTPAAKFTITDVSIVEGNSGSPNALVTVSLTEPHGNNVAVSYNTDDGTAVAGSDYTSVSGTLTFTKNQISKSILVPITGDRVIESDEYFTVRLSNPKGAKIADGAALVSIADDEPHIYVSDAFVQEGDAGTAPCDVMVFMTTPYDWPVTVNYATVDGTATAGSDYTAAVGSLTFAPNQTSQTIPVAVMGDRLGEPDKMFLVKVMTPNSYAQVNRDTALVSIADNEPHITVWDAYNYGESTITFTVSLSAQYDQVVTVDFATADGTAIAGVDYVAHAETLTFAIGETTKIVTIDVLDPTSAPDKYFSVHLSGATPNAFVATESASGIWYYDYGYGGGDWGGWDYYYYGW